jgi:hypothetical protein
MSTAEICSSIQSRDCFRLLETIAALHVFVFARENDLHVSQGVTRVRSAAGGIVMKVMMIMMMLMMVMMRMMMPINHTGV